MGMETVAVILLILFTIEIIFIFVYSSQKDDSETKQQGWGPPELPTPPSTNVFEFPEGPHGYFPDGSPGRRPGRWDDDDDDYDFDDDYKKKDKLKRIKFFLVENHRGLDSGPKKEVISDFNKNDHNKEFTVNIDKIKDSDLDKFENKDKIKLFMTYHPADLNLKWWLIDENNKKITEKKENHHNGDINLGLLSELKTQAKGKNLMLKIKVKKTMIGRNLRYIFKICFL